MFAPPFRSRSNRKPNRSKSCRPRHRMDGAQDAALGRHLDGRSGDNNWDTAANWSTDSVPGSTDDVTINISANVVHSNSVTDAINSLTSTQPLTISGGSLSIAAASTMAALTISGGTLTGAGDVTASGLVTLTPAHYRARAALNANDGILINPGSVAVGGTFNLDGRTINNPVGQTATWTGAVANVSSHIEASDGSVFNNLGAFVAEAPGGTLRRYGNRRCLVLCQRWELYAVRERLRRGNGSAVQ